MKNLFIIIPARLNSKRFPNKVLEKINGKSLVNHVWEKLQLFPNVYIATDNRSTQQKFKELFPNNIVFHSEIKNSTKLRKTKLDQAIIDLYICVYSYKFKGSYYSSFTDLILEMRKKK